MRVVVRSVHEELVERLKEGWDHYQRDVRIDSVSHRLSIRQRPSVRRISPRSSYDEE